MAIIATIPAGVTSVAVAGLHQWDYGQELEVHADWLPAMVEVHFACTGMREAAVRSCAVVQGVLKASIPDACLEQPTPVVAWVYEVGATSGRTLARVILQVEARIKPSAQPDIPTQKTVDLYQQAVEEMSKLLAEVEKGNVIVAYANKARVAEEADFALRADLAAGAIPKGTHAYDDDTGAGCAFKFEDTNGFGAGDKPGETGYFKVVLVEGDDGHKYCVLAPSKDRVQSIGMVGKVLRELHASQVHASEVDASYIYTSELRADLITADEVSLREWTKGNILPGAGVYHIRAQISEEESKDFGLVYWDGRGYTTGPTVDGSLLFIGNAGGITFNGSGSPGPSTAYYRKVFN